MDAGSLTDLLMVAVALANLTLLGASRMTRAVRVVAAQGVALGILPLLLHADAIAARTVALSAFAAVVKGVVFPWFLMQALREVEVRREVEPFVGYSVSLLLGIGLLALSSWIGSRLELPGAAGRTLAVPVALATILTGLQIVVTRRTVVNQVLGYFVFENGVYAFGVPLVKDAPLLVELGVLLDVFMAVFVMGITVFHIQRELKHLDAGELSALRDWPP